ncbi:TetR/AcrR family transcriptional regulator [Nocardioides ganghwensis]|uniref:TetR/AcrR family transcriptional regulator n=1 Tax=Nocardioides ganghwensis TaxID=252230 RepID=A0A4Q2SE64_9ACTN|nr:TetR/AcrR family transcriptional regulator [Nocardioides ganghwensis]MBD3945706.1 TetR/AcrR family transcriptional regulator [Nocardioides ganghwensis]RYC01113.1 TetR/AcrR family transcriptional regulator [Nocardioides ganghwensis]
MTTPPSRRTQADRRAGTIAALLDATVSCLTERGYAATSTAAVCAEAGVSQGALFRHFPTRQALLVATAEHVATRNVEAFRATTAGAAVDSVDDVTAVLGHLRATVLSPANQTWRELLVAARSDADLRTALLPARESLQGQMLDAAADLWGDRLPADDLPAVLSIVVNMLDGLAFSALDPDPTAAPGRTVERALRLLAEMVVSHYPQQETR